MAESISQRFIGQLEPQRDALYRRAWAWAGDGSRAEGLLQQTIRSSFGQYAKGAAPAEFAAWVEQELAAAARNLAARPATGDAAEVPEAMPADTWARLVAAVQIEAARFGGYKALNPDSVLLSPDPLLAPKKPRVVQDDPLESLQLSPTARFVVAVVVALVVGIGVTVYWSTHRWAVPATEPAATVAGTQP